MTSTARSMPPAPKTDDSRTCVGHPAPRRRHRRSARYRLAVRWGTPARLASLVAGPGTPIVVTRTTARQPSSPIQPSRQSRRLASAGQAKTADARSPEARFTSRYGAVGQATELPVPPPRASFPHVSHAPAPVPDPCPASRPAGHTGHRHGLGRRRFQTRNWPRAVAATSYGALGRRCAWQHPPTHDERDDASRPDHQETTTAPWRVT